MVYWLDVQAIPNDPGALFGWKSAEIHWNDDAVWGQGEEPYTGDWEELRYVQPHEWAGQSVDLAFGIAGDSIPDVAFDFGDCPDPSFPTYGASDAPSVDAFAVGFGQLVLGKTESALERLADVNELSDWACLAIHHLYSSVWQPVLEDHRYRRLVASAYHAHGLASPADR